MLRFFWALLSFIAFFSASLFSQSARQHLIVPSGVPLRIVLERRASYANAGAVLVGHLTQPIYVADSMAIPAGTKVLGRVTSVHSVSKQKRFNALAAGDFTPLKEPKVEFYSLVGNYGTEIPIRSIASNRDSMLIQMTNSHQHESLWHRLKSRALSRASAEKKTIEEEVHTPHKLTRLRNAALARLPYHPQVFEEGTKFVAELTSPVDVATAQTMSSVAHATAEGLPPADSILHARLTSDLSSAKNHWGDPVDAILTEPVFGPNHNLLLPEGTHLVGRVTRAEGAKRWARNGRLSFTFKQVALISGEKLAMKGRLSSVEGARSGNLNLDEEGNSTVGEPKGTHLIPLALVMASQAGIARDDDRAKGGEDTAGGGGATFGGFGLTGRILALSAGSRYIAYGIGYYGAARSFYAGFLGKGKDVVFPKNTQLEIRLDTR